MKRIEVPLTSLAVSVPLNAEDAETGDLRLTCSGLTIPCCFSNVVGPSSALTALILHLYPSFHGYRY